MDICRRNAGYLDAHQVPSHSGRCHCWQRSHLVIPGRSENALLLLFVWPVSEQHSWQIPALKAHRAMQIGFVLEQLLLWEAV